MGLVSVFRPPRRSFVELFLHLSLRGRHRISFFCRGFQSDGCLMVVKGAPVLPVLHVSVPFCLCSILSGTARNWWWRFKLNRMRHELGYVLWVGCRLLGSLL